MNNPLSIRPPQWPVKFLRFFLKEKYLEEIEGDMEEIFYENVERFSVRKAKRLYAWEMIKLLRPNLIKNLEFVNYLIQSGMFKNYFKVSFRGLMKNPVNSFINVFGLAVAIGLCVFGYAFARWTFSTDQFHKNKHSVYLTTFFANRDGVAQQYGTTPRPLGEMLREDFAQIKNVCRVEDRSVVMKHDDNVFHERVRYVDPEFLEMFTFPLKWGTTNALKDVNSIILSEPISVKYFGDENPIGSSIQMIYGKDQSKVFKIVGVAAEFPKARTISFDFLVNFENFRTTDRAYDFHDWNAFVNATFIQVDNPSDLLVIKEKMDKYKVLQNSAVKEDWAISSFSFEPLATLHEQSEYIKNDISRSSKSNYVSIYFMVVIAVFMLALACTNYINIAIATAAKRLKEIGVRKTIGATRKVVITQFLTENIVLTSFALLIGVALGYFFFIPGFESLWHFNMDFRFTDVNLWIYLPVILLVTSIASGIYPALYISRFRVTTILKGSVKFGQRNLLTKVFLCFQLIFACIFITMSVMFTQNTNYMSKRSWGYNRAGTLYAMVPDQSSFEKLSAIMVQSPNVLSISGSAHHVGKTHKSTVLHFPDHDYEVDQLSVDANYFGTMGLELKEGRTFNDFEGSDRHAVVINETLAGNIKGNPIGLVFRIDTVQYEVIGVLKDFHSYTFRQLVRPIIFKVADKPDYRFLSLKARGDSDMEVYKALQAGWSELFPEIPFEGGLQEDVWGFYYREIGIYKLVWKVFAFLAVSLATLGLYGLVRLNVEGRTKEFSIRKVLGAGIKNISANVINQYLVLFIVALCIGAPLGHWLGTWLIEFSNEYHMPITPSGAMISTVITAVVLLATVSTQIWKVMKSNPVSGLKVE
ncbi:MAG: ABC transporter permease [Cyclobacteriaceae bacterium]|nr:ABC transporter permease [Cyclobacteriaceae bacterium]